MAFYLKSFVNSLIWSSVQPKSNPGAIAPAQSIVVECAKTGVANRLDIRDFVKDIKFFSLYIQALQWMSDLPQDNDLSFYQIAGIHGQPYQAWNGARAGVENRWKGYCTHGSVLFPTWHRPYVLLFEQTIRRKAMKIAEAYTIDRAQWIKAAEELRQPYWDWADEIVPPPEVVSMSEVMIVTSDGIKRSVKNPLHHYDFHPTPEEFVAPRNEWKRSYRHPRPCQPSLNNLEDDLESFTTTMKTIQPVITAMVYCLLVKRDTWAAFSNHSEGEDTATAPNLESIHDTMHLAVGGAHGHMNDPAVAAFDPLFMMHHANADRILALWQVIHPDVWVCRGSAREGTFAIGQDELVDGDTPLMPFRRTPTEFWTSSEIRDTRKLGYSYPGFDRNVTQVYKVVNERYGRSFFKLQLPLAQKAMRAKDTPTNTLLWDWAVRVRVKHFELPASFSILFFLGSAPQEVSQWTISQTFVGLHSVFVNGTPAACSNCLKNRNMVEEEYVPLAHAIASLCEREEKGQLNPMWVSPYLRENLKWKVVKQGSEVPLGDMPSLEITVVATPLSYAEGDSFPRSGRPVDMPFITDGREGGSKIWPEAS